MSLEEEIGDVLKALVHLQVKIIWIKVFTVILKNIHSIVLQTIFHEF